ncbi:ATP-dependent DNA helicase RecG [Nakamurella lactea]|uniref:ATP-dependent DNA helicase RecG n=1 Tax=Nakamurella lactea TaxID=459515 RepID=UPI00041AB04B|nr:ATP-dependent DNA helicase RecG [Nakamurella lactea]
MAERYGDVGLDSPLRDVGVNPKHLKALDEKIGVRTVGDLLRYYPRKYNERGKLTELGKLQVGEKATVWARITDVKENQINRFSHRGPKSGVKLITKVVISDGRHRLSCAFFNQWHIAKVLKVGMEAMFAGTVKEFRGEMQLSSPQWAKLSGEGEAEEDIEILESFAGGIIPIYPLVEGLSQPMIQGAIKVVLKLLGEIDDPVPTEILAAQGMTDLDSALRDIHRPRSSKELQAAQRRLKYDEALAIQLVLARRREQARSFPAEPCPRVPDGLLAAFDAALPFTLTPGQQAVGEQIALDLSTIHPMNRLLQGEVGSGKTVVALRAMLQVIDSGRQAVLLAPTEVLAAQHARSLRTVLGPLGEGGELGAPPEATRISLLTGSMTASARKEALLTIASGQAGIAVGTHALLSDGVFFAELGLVVVDEQHRFGVEQRDALRSKGPDGNPPHVLVMTATPIPRTVAMTVYGDLETSTLSELPKGRSPISTTVVPAGEKPAWLDRAWQRVHEEVGKGHQVYIVCPKIADEPGKRSSEDDADSEWDAPDDGGADSVDEKRPPLSVEHVATLLAEGPLADLRLATLHGRMVPADKDETMRRFAAGEIDVLVSTTVIEVGVDVANATMMVIMDAERFGLSQLHQLRGRVGRGSAPGICLLVTEAPGGSPSRMRLAAVEATTDGFELADRDLELRKEGNVLGTSQAGTASALRQLSLTTDRDIVEAARHDAQDLVDSDPGFGKFPGLLAMAESVIGDEGQEFLTKG